MKNLMERISRCDKMAVITTLFCLILLSAIHTNAKEVDLNKDGCDLFMITTENYVNATGYIFTYNGGKEIDCSLPVNIRHAKGDGICVVPLLWEADSCGVNVRVVFDDFMAFSPDPEIQEVWNCSSTPKQLCYNKTWAALFVNASEASTDKFRIRMYLTGQTVFPRGYNETRDDDDEDDGEGVPTGGIVGIVVGAVILVAILLVVGVLCSRRRNQEYSTTTGEAS